MKITFLGSGNAFAPQRDWASILVNETILLDVGPSALLNFNRLALDTTRVRHIFISHFHADHCFGLPFLLLNYYFVARTDEPLAIIGPPGMEAYVHQLMTFAYPELFRDWPRPITFVETQVGELQTVDGLTFSAVPVDHASGVLTAVGYRLHLDDGILAYSGDTRMADSLYTLIDGARVCILEATSQETSDVHLGVSAIRTLLTRMPEETIVLLNHLDTPSAAPWQGLPVIVPQDRSSYEFFSTPRKESEG